ncbi:McrB family protein [Flagellimonas sp.]|uniref:McrB family protein n=1 Tax=Flagellimonas sp. TaxID=2058762 RepID=UPI003BA95BB3
MKLPNLIEKKYLLEAAKTFKEKGPPPECMEETRYKVLINGEEFPPPAIAKYAFFHKYNEWPDQFDGGLGTDCFKMIESGGFKIKLDSKIDYRYLEVEELVYNQLIKLNKEQGTTFSVRQNATKNSELDYFIGTSESEYSAFSLWDIPRNTYGAIDIIAFIFGEVEPDIFTIELQFLIQKNQDSFQDATTRELGELIKKRLTEKQIEFSESKLSSKQFKFTTSLTKNRFRGEVEFIKGLNNYIATYSDIIDSAIYEIKREKPEYKAGTYSPVYFEKLIKKLETRRDKYQKLISVGSSTISSKGVLTEKMKHNLNTIFYGPPGTGKTYKTILRAAEIIEKRKICDYNEALKIFKANLHSQIEFITFHQNYSYEDFIQGLRPDTENDNQLYFKKADGIFKRIVDRAFKNPYYVPVGTEFKDYRVIKSNSDIIELWSERTKSIRYVPFQLIKDLIDGINSGKIELDDIKNRRNIDLPGLLESNVEKYYFGIEGTLYSICEFLTQQNVDFSEENFVIVIDEINRANISRVFGELITLIEPDKRSEGKTPLVAKLPSGDHFSVPSNLYIIGTMNTADKSIALLDIALRRRFVFEAMYPEYEIEGQEIYDIDILKKINERIIKTKGHDFQIGHAYFMGENDNLVSRMNNKVIPLLLEYYMNDKEEVVKILHEANLIIEENSWPLRITGKND